ncbi:hypothetical protein ACODNH_05495 [Haloarcula sp. NS06]|uniref:hypothetical protein n=1 Tax=Haloarcula sp. NS06 TaxID=3409688 RepID=UPI003DA7574F
MSKSNDGRNKNTPTERTVDSLQSRDSPEATTSQKMDSRGDASHTQRTQIGTGSSTRTDATEFDNTVRACPECDTTSVEARLGDKLRGQPSDTHYACRHCGATFDESTQRDRQHALPEEMACIEDPTGVLLAPTADIQLTEFANATVATPESEEWIKSNVVVDREAWC